MYIVDRRYLSVMAVKFLVLHKAERDHCVAAQHTIYTCHLCIDNLVTYCFRQQGTVSALDCNQPVDVQIVLL